MGTARAKIDPFDTSWMKTKEAKEPKLESRTEKVVIDGSGYEITYKEWMTFKNEKASGFSCQIEKNVNIASQTREGIIEQITNYKPQDNNASQWYGQGIYTGD